MPEKWGFLDLKDLHMNYYDNYMAIGISPKFKRFNESDFEDNWIYDYFNIEHIIVEKGKIDSEKSQKLKQSYHKLYSNFI